MPPLGAIVETLLIVGGLVAQWLWLPHSSTQADAGYRLDDLTQLLQHHVLTNDRYSLIGPLFSTPLWLLGRVNQTPTWWLARFNLFVFAAGLLLLYRLLRPRVDGGLVRGFLLILTAASMFPNHLENYYGEVFTAICVGVGVLAAVIGGRARAVIGWVAVAVGVANAPATLVGLGLVALRRMFSQRRWRYALAGVGAAALVGAEAWLRRGSPFATGYAGDQGVRTIMPFSAHPGFSYPFWFGLLAIILSFGKGLLFFAPGILLPVKSAILALRSALKHELLEVYELWLAFVVGLVLVYASWWAWYGGWTWGPRFFLFASIPASFAVALHLRDRASSLPLNLLTLLVLLLSFWVGINGAVFGQADLAPTCLYNNFAQEQLCWFTPDFSVLWHPLVVAYQSGWHWNVFARTEGLTPAYLGYIGYSVLALVYLAAPLALRTGRQAWSAARTWAEGNLKLVVTRF
jgi:hypothetical protein